MTTFVLVHGAFFGAWCWRRVIPRLEAGGHEVHAVTLTGLGELAHLLTPDVGLQTHIDDVVNLLESRDLRDVVLVGHSYAGMVIGGASHQVPQRLAHLIYLDAFVPEHGKSLFDLQVKRFRDELQALAEAGGAGWKIPPLDPSGETLGVTDPKDIEWLRSRLTAHPLRTLKEHASLRHPKADEISRTYILCTGNPPDGSFPSIAERLKVKPDWNYLEVPSSHSAMITAPDALADGLLKFV